MLYIIVWHGTYDNIWKSDGVFANKAVAEAKLNFERLSHPDWTFEMVEAENPSTRHSVVSSEAA